MAHNRLLLCMILAAASTINAAITFVDADLTNTTIGGVTPVEGTNYNAISATDPLNDLWGYRTRPNTNGGFVWACDAGGDEDTDPLITTITIANAGTYDLYGHFYAHGDWDSSFSVGSDGPYSFFGSGDATQAQISDFEGSVSVADGSSILMYNAYLGTVTTTTANEQVSVYVQGIDGPIVTNDERTWYDGVGYCNTIELPDFDPPDGIQPENLLLNVGQTAVFTALAETAEGTDYQWYKLNEEGADIPVGNPNDPDLIIPAVSLTDEGSYYCRASNNYGASNSNLVNLGIKQLMAHWPLDGDWLDVSGNARHASPAGTPVFSAGISDTGVEIDPDNGWATAGTWNPSEYTDRLTLSLWAKWYGLNGTFQGLISKRDSWAATDMMWTLRASSNLPSLKFNNFSNEVNAGSLTTGQWQHICVTYDGVSAKVYIDAELISSGNFQYDQKTDAMNVLGAIEVNDIYSFNGAMDDIRIYNYDLTFEEVAILYTDQRPEESFCFARPEYDFDGDCYVGLSDLLYFIENWLGGQQ